MVETASLSWPLLLHVEAISQGVQISRICSTSVFLAAILLYMPFSCHESGDQISFGAYPITAFREVTVAGKKEETK